MKKKKIRECEPWKIQHEIKRIAGRFKFHFINTKRLMDGNIESLAEDLESGLERMGDFSTAEAADFIWLCNLGVTLAEKTAGECSFLRRRLQGIKNDAVWKCQSLGLSIEVVNLNLKRNTVSCRLGSYEFHAPLQL